MKKILMGLMLILVMTSNSFANKFHGVIAPEDNIMLPVINFIPREAFHYKFPLKHYEYDFIVHTDESNPIYKSIFILGRLDLISYKENTGDFVYKLSLSNAAFSTEYTTNTKEYIPKHSKFTLDNSKKNYVIVKGRYNRKSNNVEHTNFSLINITANTGVMVILDAARDIPFTVIYD